MVKKYKELKEYLMNLEKVCIAFSGGVDSTLLVYVVKKILRDNVLAVIVRSPFMPKEEYNEAENFLKANNINYEVIQFDINVDRRIVENSKDRCYHCKYNIFYEIKKIAQKYDIDIIMDGSNKDDEDDYRPGVKALNELGIVSPLKMFGLRKEEIRSLSKELNLKTWEKPAFACLASRIPYNTLITEKKLKMVEESEIVIRNLGFSQFRVRFHDNIARIELLPEDRIKVFSNDIDKIIQKEFIDLGFTYVTLDISGYKMGSLNREIL